MLPATLLIFNLPDAELMKLRGLCVPLDLRLKAVPPESFTLPLGAMLGMPVAPADAPVPVDSFTEPMLLMCNLTEDQFNRLLALLRGPGMPRIPLKAVLTPHNVGWNALQLHAALNEEREMMRRQRP